MDSLQTWGRPPTTFTELTLPVRTPASQQASLQLQRWGGGVSLEPKTLPPRELVFSPEQPTAAQTPPLTKQTHSQGLCSRNLRSDPSPSRAVMATELGGSLSHTRLWLQPLHLQPITYQGASCQHTLRKYMTCAHVRSSSPTKATGHMQTI